MVVGNALLLWVFSFLTVVVQNEGQSNDQLQQISHRCEPVTVPMCRGIGYSMTILPNMMNHQKQDQAGLEAHTFFPLVKVNCSPDLKVFLCALYVPRCTIVDRPIPPCQSLCVAARDGCAHLMKRFGFEWPDHMQCDKFPDGPDLCIGHNTSEGATPSSAARLIGAGTIPLPSWPPASSSSSEGATTSFTNHSIGVRTTRRPSRPPLGKNIGKGATTSSASHSIGALTTLRRNRPPFGRITSEGATPSSAARLIGAGTIPLPSRPPASSSSSEGATPSFTNHSIGVRNTKRPSRPPFGQKTGKGATTSPTLRSIRAGTTLRHTGPPFGRNTSEQATLSFTSRRLDVRTTRRSG